MRLLWRTAALGALCLTLAGCDQVLNGLFNQENPHSLSASKGEGTGISLSWQAPKFKENDTRKVSSYRVYREGTSIGSPSSSSWTDTQVGPGVSYSYSVSAVLDNGTETGRSNSASGWYVPGKALLWGDQRGTFSDPGTVTASTEGWFKTLVVQGWTYHVLPGSGTVEIRDWDAPWTVLASSLTGTELVWTAGKTRKVWVQETGQGRVEAWHD